MANKVVGTAYLEEVGDGQFKILDVEKDASNKRLEITETVTISLLLLIFSGELHSCAQFEVNNYF